MIKKIYIVLFSIIISTFFLACGDKNIDKKVIDTIEVKEDDENDDAETKIIESSDFESSDFVDDEKESIANADEEKLSDNSKKDSDDRIISNLIDSNTNENLLKKYISYHIYKYGIHKNGNTVIYKEGYEDRQGNKVLRLGTDPDGKELNINKLPYLVSVNNKKYVKIEDNETTSLSKDYFLNKDEEVSKNIVEHIFNNKSMMIDKYNSYELSEKDNEHTITLTIDDENIINDKNFSILDFEFNGVDNLRSIVIDINYDIITYIISEIYIIGIDKDNNVLPLYNYKIEYDEQVPSFVKLVNEEEGEVVSFDLKALENANTYEKMKEELTSLNIRKEVYKKGKLDSYFDIYVDTDGYIVVNDADGSYHVKYEKKWYDILDDNISEAGKYSEYEMSPIIQVIGTRSLIFPNDKIITSYGKGDDGVLIQEYDSDNKTYRRETLFSLDDNIARSIRAYEMDGNLEGNTIFKIAVNLDADTPNSLDRVIDFVEGEEE